MSSQFIRRSVLALVVLAPVLAVSAPGSAAINVEFRPAIQTVAVGSIVPIGVYVVSDSAVPQGLAAAQIIVGWQPSALQMLTNSNSGAVPLLSSGFPSPDPYGLNESALPQDGNAIYVALASFGSPVMATPGGTLLTTLRFQALAQTPLTPVDILASAGNPAGQTTVFDGAVPNLSVTGTLHGAAVTIIPAPSALGGLGLAAGLARRRQRR